MALDGYVPYAVSPVEAASGGYCIVTSDNSTRGAASVALERWESGRYDVAVNYYDLAIGNSTWELWIGEEMVGEWKGDLEYRIGKAPVFYIDGQTATRITFRGVEVTKGDVLKIVGVPDGQEPAPVDYISVLPEGVVD